MTTPVIAESERVPSLAKQDIADIFARLERGELSVAEWYDQTGDSLAVYHRVAWMAGAGTRTLSAAAEAAIERVVQEQLAYLENFAGEIADALDDEGAAWARWRQRAAMYGDAVYATASRGATALWQLPAHPADGSQICLTNCRCRWDANILDEEELDADFYWRLGGSDHCETCVANAARWSPLHIRGGKY